MKLELDVWRCLLDVYTKFQTNISKHVKKGIENFLKKIQKIQKNRPSYENKIFATKRTYVKKYTEG